jgi:triacylglycerol esterase/lipase EstA (alpha/beta hydrolase family)
MANNHQVVFVHGLFGWGPKELGGLPYWGSAFVVPSKLKRHQASVGPLSSAHDRACELAAQIKGTKVDYGLEHATKEGHAQFGIDYSHKPGFVPGWSAKKPVHLVGHSLGSPTVRCLQHLLAIDYWGWGSNAQWVASISTVSGVSNGSTALYFLGANEQTGLLNPASLTEALFGVIELGGAATRGFFDAVYDFDLGHWGFVRAPDEPLAAYLHRVAESPFLHGKDNANYSLTLQGAYADNQVWKTDPNTHYFSYVTEQTTRGFLSGRCYPDPLMNPAFLPISAYIGRKQFAKPPIPVANFESADWFENDGLVPSYSQLYPRISGHHPVGGEMTADTPNGSFKKGQWYYQWERGIDHLDICVTPQLNQIGWQQRFYTALFARLAAL